MKYQKADVRKESILDSAVWLAERDGYMNIRREDVAHFAQCSVGTVNRYYGNMHQLRTAVMRRAIKTGRLKIIAQGLVNDNIHANRASDELKAAAAQHLIKG